MIHLEVCIYSRWRSLDCEKIYSQTSLRAICDAPAKAKVLNTKSNTMAIFGCSWLGKIKGNIKLNNQQIQMIKYGFQSNQISFPNFEKIQHNIEL